MSEIGDFFIVFQKEWDCSASVQIKRKKGAKNSLAYKKKIIEKKWKKTKNVSCFSWLERLRRKKKMEQPVSISLLLLFSHMDTRNNDITWEIFSRKKYNNNNETSSEWKQQNKWICEEKESRRIYKTHAFKHFLLILNASGGIQVVIDISSSSKEHAFKKGITTIWSDLFVSVCNVSIGFFFFPSLSHCVWMWLKIE